MTDLDSSKFTGIHCLILMGICCMTRGKESMIFSIQSDVYSFGVFLVELISGRTAASDQGIIEWVNSTDS